MSYIDATHLKIVQLSVLYDMNCTDDNVNENILTIKLIV